MKTEDVHAALCIITGSLSLQFAEVLMPNPCKSLVEVALVVKNFFFNRSQLNVLNRSLLLAGMSQTGVNCFKQVPSEYLKQVPLH